MNQPDTNNQSIVIEDLAAQNADEIKDGPRFQSYRFAVRLSSVAGGQAEQQLVTVTGPSSNHNETVAADEAEDNDDAGTSRLTDLAVDEAQSEEVKGGMKGDFSRGHQPDLKR